MEIEQSKSSSESNKAKESPKKGNTITKSTEPGFDLETCFEQQFIVPEEGYIKDSDSYFDSYSHFAIHEEMLKDQVREPKEERTLAYKDAIMKNPHLFEGKIVLDIGCGTGILSIFAAKAGAKHVYGIEYAAIANHARRIVKENNLADKITVLKGKVEEIQLPVEHVDIIISEWMGYFLLYESMFDTVLYARDKWLRPGGLMFPDRAIMFIASIEDEEYKNNKINFWDNVYGVNMTSIKRWAIREPLVDVVDNKIINSNTCPIFDINLNTVTKEQLEFSAGYRLKFTRNDKVHAFVAWFDVYFSACHIPVKLSTSPFSKETHWKHTVFYLEDILHVRKGEEIYGSIAVKKNKTNFRELDIKIGYNFMSKIKQISHVQFFRLT